MVTRDAQRRERLSALLHTRRHAHRVGRLAPADLLSGQLRRARADKHVDARLDVELATNLAGFAFADRATLSVIPDKRVQNSDDATIPGEPPAHREGARGPGCRRT